MALLEINKLKKEFGDFLLFDDVTFSIDKNDRVALIGNNGCGKTTLIKMILGQLQYKFSLTRFCLLHNIYGFIIIYSLTSYRQNRIYVCALL